MRLCSGLRLRSSTPQIPPSHLHRSLMPAPSRLRLSLVPVPDHVRTICWHLHQKGTLVPDIYLILSKSQTLCPLYCIGEAQSAQYNQQRQYIYKKNLWFSSPVLQR